MRRLRKSKFQQRLEEVQKKHQEMTPVSQDGASLSAQPPNPNGDLNWKDVKDELPQYYSPIHIWDGKTMYKSRPLPRTYTSSPPVLLTNPYMGREDDV